MSTTTAVTGQADVARTSEFLGIGTRVEVRNSYLQTWSRGFQVAGIIHDAYLIRRLSDRAILPRSFSAEDVRPC